MRIEPSAIFKDIRVRSLGITDSKTWGHMLLYTVYQASRTQKPTPGGALMNCRISVIQLNPGVMLIVNPHNVSFTRDSLTVVSGTIKEVSRSFSRDFGLDV